MTPYTNTSDHDSSFLPQVVPALGSKTVVQKGVRCRLTALTPPNCDPTSFINRKRKPFYHRSSFLETHAFHKYGLCEMMSAAMEPTSFLSLPPEVRFMIYAHVLREPHSHPIAIPSLFSTQDYQHSYPTFSTISLALISVKASNQHIAHETQAFFFSNNVFVVDTKHINILLGGADKGRPKSPLVTALLENLDQIKRLHIVNHSARKAQIGCSPGHVIALKLQFSQP